MATCGWKVLKIYISRRLRSAYNLCIKVQKKVFNASSKQCEPGRQGPH